MAYKVLKIWKWVEIRNDNVCFIELFFRFETSCLISVFLMIGMPRWWYHTYIIKIIHLNFRISIYSKRQFLYFIYQYGFPISLN
jgi:hypothetical protein